MALPHHELPDWQMAVTDLGLDGYLVEVRKDGRLVQRVRRDRMDLFTETGIDAIVDAHEQDKAERLRSRTDRFDRSGGRR